MKRRVVKKPPKDKSKKRLGVLENARQCRRKRKSGEKRGKKRRCIKRSGGWWGEEEVGAGGNEGPRKERPP